MSFFNDAQKDALLTGRYICSKCGARMQFEDEWEDILVCLECGHSVELERYGMEDDGGEGNAESADSYRGEKKRT